VIRPPKLLVIGYWFFVLMLQAMGQWTNPNPTGVTAVAIMTDTNGVVLGPSTINFSNVTVLGVGGGAGSGFPLTADASAGNFGVSNFTFLAAGQVTADFVSPSQGLTLGAETPISAWSDLNGSIDPTDYLKDLQNSYGTPPATNWGFIKISDPGGHTAYIQGYLTGTDGVTVSMSGNDIIIHGYTTTGTVETFFPAQSDSSVRLYFRTAAAGHDLIASNFTTACDGYYLMIRTNAAGLPFIVADSALVGESTNAALLQGLPASYFRNFANHTNENVFDNGLLQGADNILGFDFGEGLSAVLTHGYTNAAGQTGAVYVLTGNTGTGACETCDNDWSGSNTWTSASTMILSPRRFWVRGYGSTNSGDWSWVPPGSTGNMAIATASAVVGGRRNNATAQGAIVGGEDNTASGADSAALGGDHNTASGANSVNIGGAYNQATASRAISIGGEQNNAAASYAVAVGGYENDVSGGYSVGLGTFDFDISGQQSVGFGQYGTLSHDRTVMFGWGQSQTQRVESGRGYSVLFLTTTTNEVRIGVNTNNPVAALDVNGGFNFTGPITSNGNPLVFSATVTNAVGTVVTEGDGTTSTPQVVRFAAGNGAAPTSTVAGTTTTVHQAASGAGGGGTVTWTSTWATATVGADTNTTILVPAGVSNSILASLGTNREPAFRTAAQLDLITGAAASSAFYSASNPSGFIPGAEASNRFYLASNPSNYVRDADVSNRYAHLTGETNVIDLTLAASVSAPDPVADSNVATKGWVNSQSASYVTNAISIVELNGGSAQSGLSTLNVVGPADIVVSLTSSGSTGIITLSKGWLTNNNTHATGTTNTFDAVVVTTINGAAYAGSKWTGDGSAGLYPTLGGHTETATYGFNIIGGGQGNNNAGEFGTIAGGRSNVISGSSGADDAVTISGGDRNAITIGDSSNLKAFTIGGGYNNTASTGQKGLVIGGGYQNSILRSESGLISGGQLCYINGTANISDSPHYPVIGGGYLNLIYQSVFEHQYAPGIFCGSQNSLSNCQYTTILGGTSNKGDESDYGAVIGGSSSWIKTGSGQFSFGGSCHVTNCNFSTAMGRNCRIGHNDVFMWNGSASTWSSTEHSQVLFRAVSGVGINTNNPKAALHVGGGDAMVDSTNRYMLGTLAWLTLDASGTNLLFVAGTNVANMVTNRVTITAL
jgi:hypothetical protein